jgi:Protein kinase domain
VIPSWYNVVLTQMLEALVFLHSKKGMIIHRNITPQHILYNQLDCFVLAGFSLARIVSTSNMAYDGRRTLKYLPPEVYDSSQETVASDIWSLGILCLDMLHMLPNVEVDLKHQSFPMFKLGNWCSTMCELAKHAGRPEMEMMVVERTDERSPASALLELARSNPSRQIRRFRPSVDLLYFGFRHDVSCNHLTNQELREYAGSYLDKLQPPPPPGSRGAGSQSRAERSTSRTGPKEWLELSFSSRAQLLLEAGLQELGPVQEYLKLMAKFPQEASQQTLSHTSSPWVSQPLSLSTPSRRSSPPTSQGTASSSRSNASTTPVGAADSKERATGAGETVAPSISTSESKHEFGNPKGEQPVRETEGRTKESPTAQPTEGRGQTPGRPEVPSQRNQACQGRAKLSSPPSRKPEAYTEKSDVNTKISSPPPSRPPEAPVHPEKAKFGQVSSPSTPEPEGQEFSPPSTRRTQNQPEQLKAKAKQPSPSSAPRPGIQEPSLPSSSTAETSSELDKAEAKRPFSSTSRAQGQEQSSFHTDTPGEQGKAKAKQPSPSTPKAKRPDRSPRRTETPIEQRKTKAKEPTSPQAQRPDRARPADSPPAQGKARPKPTSPSPPSQSRAQPSQVQGSTFPGPGTHSVPRRTLPSRAPDPPGQSPE